MLILFDTKKNKKTKAKQNKSVLSTSLVMPLCKMINLEIVYNTRLSFIIIIIFIIIIRVTNDAREDEMDENLG